MKAKIVRIGNSRGLRIPKALLVQTGLEGEVDIQVEDGSLVVSPVTRPRSGWGPVFEAMSERGDDVLLDPGDPTSDWDETEWVWE